jgi:TolA-binding protein
MRHVMIVGLLVFIIVAGTQWLGRWVGQGQVKHQRQSMDSRNIRLIQEERARIANNPERQKHVRQMEAEIARMTGLNRVITPTQNFGRQAN